MDNLDLTWDFANIDELTSMGNNLCHAIFAQNGALPMTVKYTEQQLLEEAIARLGDRLPVGWEVDTTSYQTPAEADLLIDVKGPQASHQALIVEAKPSITPRDIQTMLGSGLVRRLRALGGREILLVSPFLSPRSRELLKDEGINYLDLTGNVRVSLTNPGLFIETTGQDRNPFGDPRPSRGLKGAKVGNVVRVLVDCAPPMTVSEIASAARVNAGYVTRILESLENEDLIARGPRGRVEQVEWKALLRRRAESLDLLAPHKTKLFIARNGTRDLLDRLEENPPERTMITGSFAASRYVRKAAPALLVAYTFIADEIATRFNLLDATEGADVALVRPENNGVFFDVDNDESGLLWAAPSQIVIDCLSGNGRMPVEGDALTDWMENSEDAWRNAGPSFMELPEWAT